MICDVLRCPACELPMIAEDKHDDRPNNSFTCPDCCTVCAEQGAA